MFGSGGLHKIFVLPRGWRSGWGRREGDPHGRKCTFVEGGDGRCATGENEGTTGVELLFVVKGAAAGLGAGGAATPFHVAGVEVGAVVKLSASIFVCFLFFLLCIERCWRFYVYAVYSFFWFTTATRPIIIFDYKKLKQWPTIVFVYFGGGTSIVDTWFRSTLSTLISWPVAIGGVGLGTIC